MDHHFHLLMWFQLPPTQQCQPNLYFQAKTSNCQLGIQSGCLSALQSLYLQLVLHHLSSLPWLASLSIHSFARVKNSRPTPYLSLPLPPLLTIQAIQFYILNLPQICPQLSISIATFQAHLCSSLTPLPPSLSLPASRVLLTLHDHIPSLLSEGFS